MHSYTRTVGRFGQNILSVKKLRRKYKENRNKLIFIPLIGALVLALGIGLLTFSQGSATCNILVIKAQEDEPDQPFPWKGGLEGKFIAYLLGELGLDPADVRDALQSAYEDVVQDAVDDGVLTKDQAEDIFENGFAGRKFGKRGGGLGW